MDYFEEMRHDPTLHPNQSDFKSNFSQSSQYCAIEIFFLKKIALCAVPFQLWLEVQDQDWNEKKWLDSFPLTLIGHQSWGPTYNVGMIFGIFIKTSTS